MAIANTSTGAHAKPLAERYTEVRAFTAELAAPLSDADATVQSMPDASPAKWHLAHTTWFFETMLLARFAPAYQPYDPTFAFLFNSYYETLGERQPRPRRGMITRPSLDEVMAYRAYVDGAMMQLMGSDLSPEAHELVGLGCHHEQQHQELLLTDILHLFAQSPTKPTYRAPQPLAFDDRVSGPASWIGFEGGIESIGHAGEGFAFDCEGPRHERLLQPFELADRLVTNAEWIAFIEDGGYSDPLLWLSEGWATVNSEDWTAPLYWEKRDGDYWSMTLRGLQPVDPTAPVCHVSYFEADAFATWSKARLPREDEWEVAVGDREIEGNFADSRRLRPRRAEATEDGALSQMYGDVWEWTSSPFAAYPGFKALPGAVGEYNGKFMCGQFVLRGGSCVTPPGHVRRTYRNFFPPAARWQFSGLRLARDV